MHSYSKREQEREASCCQRKKFMFEARKDMKINLPSQIRVVNIDWDGCALDINPPIYQTSSMMYSVIKALNCIIIITQTSKL